MAFSFDSQLGLSAVLLCIVAALAWRLAGGRGASVRLNLRFAAILFAALGVASVAASWSAPLGEIAFAIALLVLPIAATALALSLFAPRPAPPLAASIALVAGLAAGLVAMVMDAPVFSLGGLTLAVAAIVLVAAVRLRDARLPALEMLGGGLALFFGDMALANDALAAALIFFGAGLLGLACASQLRVEQQAAAGLFQAIGRPRL